MDHCYFLLTCQVKIVIVIYLLVELNSDSERIWKWMERFVTDFLFFFFFLTSQALIKFLALMTRCQEGCSKSICFYNLNIHSRIEDCQRKVARGVYFTITKQTKGILISAGCIWILMPSLSTLILQSRVLLMPKAY